jgi:shikimate kinase/3-dehydroquinate synthase
MYEPGGGFVLVGMPGSGKSTVGRLLATALDREFVDTDALFEARHGSPVPAYLAEHGEPAFRAAESAVVAEACTRAGAVIAVGGGAVLDPLNRWALWHHGTVAWLDVPPEELVARLERDPLDRPTFRPYSADRLRAVLEEREPFYRAADIRLDAIREPAATRDALLEGTRAPPGRRLYDAEVARHHPIGPTHARIVIGVELPLDAHVPLGVAIVDRRVDVRVPARARLDIAGGERSKRLRSLGTLLDWLAEQAVERGEALVAVGGGTVGDLAGTAAALFNRGLPLVHVPTTWLAMSDSAIGGKVAVDLATAKNAVGAFWPPVAVIADVAQLRTLPARLRRDGMAESVKSGLIGDPALWHLLETRGRAALAGDEPARYAIVERSARLKIGVCDRDPFEAAERRTLNLGHTAGHALEVASGYRLRHGPAVALGLRVAGAIATGRGANPDLAPRLDALLDRLGFRLRIPFDADAVRAAMGTDKKRAAGRQRWILPMEIGHVTEVDDVTEAELERAIAVIRE